MSSAGLRTERVGSSLVLTFERAEAKNALSRALVQELVQAVEQASAEPALRAVVIASTGNVFAAGGDLREFEQLRTIPGGSSEVVAMGTSLQALERCELPVIAAVQGAAFGGGCELILACDMAVMETQAALHFRQAAMGLTCGWGGTTRLLERVGPMRAAQLLMTGRAVTAEQAAAWHLVSEVAETGKALEGALRLAREAAQQPRAAVAGCKRAMLEVRQAYRAEAFGREARVFASLWNGPDHQAAMAAFLGKSG